ncbi:MAG TPA: hypothetical protein VEF89_05045 [Solirubrobacteraceae bacterium]|nr:hypothetical protein [Solirubrobacteraceae bacterium]
MGHTTITHETLAPAAACASVALDIGAGRGALVLYPSERFRGREIEISPADGDARRVHTGVHDRSTAAGSRLTAVFGSLSAGAYLVWEDERTPGPLVTVPDGGVAEVGVA